MIELNDLKNSKNAEVFVAYNRRFFKSIISLKEKGKQNYEKILESALSAGCFEYSEYLKSTKIVDLGSDYLDVVKFGKYQNKRRSLGLNQSGFDNDETITRSITSNLSSASIH